LQIIIKFFKNYNFSLVFIHKKVYLVNASGHKQHIIYNIFDWTKNENSKLVVVGLSNRIDFVQFFDQKV
jgi:Cdc6-like AAA superfamily ATPase